MESCWAQVLQKHVGSGTCDCMLAKNLQTVSQTNKVPFSGLWQLEGMRGTYAEQLSYLISTTFIQPTLQSPGNKHRVGTGCFLSV